MDYNVEIDCRNSHGANPLGVTVWASKNFRNKESDYPGCVTRFLDAGLEIEPWMVDSGSAEVAAVLAERGSPI